MFKRRRGSSVGPQRRVRARTAPVAARRLFVPRFRPVRYSLHKSKRRIFRSRKGRGRSFRRRFKGRRRRRFGRRRPRNSNTAKVINALQPWQTYTAEYGQEHTVQASGSDSSCFYFTCELTDTAAGTTKNNVTTIELLDYRHLGTMFIDGWLGTVANSFNGPVGVSANNYTSNKSKMLVKGWQLSRIRNQSNEPVRITCYWLRPRHDINLNVGSSGVANLYTTMANGFIANGINVANQTPSTNAGMTEARYSPFNSFDLCRDFKIYRVQKKVLNPSDMTTFSLKSKPVIMRPMDLWQHTGTSTANWDADPTKRKYDFHRRCRVLLFRVDSNPAGWGAAQANYTKNIQQTTPTVLMDTLFRYECKMVHIPPTPTAIIESAGIANNAGVGPAIIVPDGDVVGVEADAL